MITIGITGGYATGKTKVAKLFEKLGAEVLYADRIAHSVMRPHTAVWEEVVKYFGRGILKKGDSIDRNKLAKIVFQDKRKLNKLNKIVHPFVREELKRIIQDRVTRCGRDILAVEIPLLFEAGLESWFTKTIVVTCDKGIQYKRASARDGLKKNEILQRIKSQWSMNKKKEKADFVVDNSGSLEETRRQVVSVWEKLKT